MLVTVWGVVIPAFIFFPVVISVIVGGLLPLAFWLDERGEDN
jgi:uncharacterized membrane protein